MQMEANGVVMGSAADTRCNSTTFKMESHTMSITFLVTTIYITQPTNMKI